MPYIVKENMGRLNRSLLLTNVSKDLFATDEHEKSILSVENVDVRFTVIAKAPERKLTVGREI